MLIDSVQDKKLGFLWVKLHRITSNSLILPVLIHYSFIHLASTELMKSDENA